MVSQAQLNACTSRVHQLLKIYMHSMLVYLGSPSL